MLRQRIITAIILALIFVAIVLYGDANWVSGMFALVLLAATRELILLTLKTSSQLALGGGAIFAGSFWWSLPLAEVLVLWQALAGIVLWLLITLGLMFYRHHGNWPLGARILLLGLGIDLLWIAGHCLVFLHQAYGGWMLLFLFTLVWIADIGAYFSGRRFGKHKLAPGISPGKTREGAAGGMVANLLWIPLVFAATGLDWISWWLFLLIGLSTVAISIVGDLFESVLKREAGVKDSGSLLPGHGGVLDRIDSVIAAAPIFVGAMMLAAAS